MDAADQTRGEARSDAVAAAWHARLTAAALASSDPTEALERVCREIRALVGCDRVQIWRGDLRQQIMHAPVAVGYDAVDAALLHAARIPIQSMPFATDFLERKYLTLANAESLRHVDVAVVADFGIRAIAMVLIERGDRVLGALQLSWCGTPTPRFPTRAEADVFRAHAALALDMLARTADALRTASTLSETAMLLASIHDPDVLLEAIARRITDAVGCEIGAVYLLDPDRGVTRLAAGVGAPDVLDALRSFEGPLDRFEELLATAEDGVLEFPETRADVRFAPYPLATRVASFLNVPLRRGDDLIGSLTLGYTERTGRFARRQVTLAKGLAHHAVVALETARLVRSLEEANRVKGDFVAAVSHDLRTPIHILLGYADMLLDGAAGDLTPEQRDLVDRIRERSLSFRDLVDGILAVARLDAQRGHALAAPTRLDQLCTSVLRELDDRRAPGVALRWRARPVVVHVDAPKVRMILRNLVSNALKFTTTGTVVATAEVDGDALRLRVSDSGPGIDPEDRAAVFEMFHQGSAARRAGGSGLGLGLYLVRRLASVLGGTARLVDAEPGNTCFEVTVPLAPERPRA